MTDEETTAKDKAEKEATARFQKLEKDFNDQRERLEKAEKKADEQEKRAKKAERGSKDKVDAEEVNEWKQKFEMSQEQNAEQIEQLTKLANVQKQNAIMSAVGGVSNYTDNANNLVGIALNAQTKMDNGKLVAIDSMGQIRLSKATMQPMTAEELRDEIIQQTPSLIKAKVDGGTGSNGNERSGDGGMLTMTQLEAMPADEQQKVLKEMKPEDTRRLLKSVSD